MSPVILLPVDGPPDPDPYYTHITSVGPTPTYYYPLRETSGPVATEEIVGGTPGMDGVYSNVIFSQPSLTPSATTLSVGFNGGTSNVNSLGDPPTYDEWNFIHQTGIFTMSCWIQLTTLTSQEYAFIGNTATNSEVGWLWEFIDGAVGRTNAFRFIIYDGSAPPAIEAFQDNAITDTNPHHIAVKGDGTNVWFYVDGSEFMAVNTMTALPGGNANRTPNLGRWNFTVPGGYLNGVIEDYAVWNSTLSAGQILAQYNAG